MNVSAARVAAIVAATALPIHVLVGFASGAGVLMLLIYAGIALPAVWSAKPARRKAAAEVLRQVLSVFRRS